MNTLLIVLSPVIYLLLLYATAYLIKFVVLIIGIAARNPDVVHEFSCLKEDDFDSSNCPPQ